MAYLTINGAFSQEKGLSVHCWLHTNGSSCLKLAMRSVLFFDLKKAFDSVPHRALLDKLHEINLHPALIKWICSYLANRTQQVVVNCL